MDFLGDWWMEACDWILWALGIHWLAIKPVAE